ncbi:signal peptidase I [Phocaeicola oris]|uniref:signal peptidase I n=1 Tax=Phocaeicola oris TaxID=2896850 RepID=UPI00234F4644|nr:signal peptidase I [Phocaeicola oris]MCE2617497.1 signal peptidase I [Phocaeicola oris]
MKIKFQHCIEWLYRISIIALIGIALYFIGIIFLFASFSIPSSSMEPTLIPGDNVLVLKWQYGSRVFNINDAIDHHPLKIHHLPGTTTIKRNDIVVFNFPYPEKKDSIGFDVLLYYIKRCIALPGDSLYIKDGFYNIAGYDGVSGNRKKQLELKRILNDSLLLKINGVSMKTFPQDSALCWTLKNFGPLYIPEKGKTVRLSHKEYALYKNYIEWEQRKKLYEQGSAFLLNDSVITEYSFLKNYYFMAGDNAIGSNDSRYWGLVPEEYIVGKVWRIWKSVYKMSGRINRSRIGKKIE